ncbi:MAG: DUF1345 domain-containing protein [Actinomycetota bacterium]
MAAPRFRHVSSRSRVNICGSLGIAAGAVVALVASWQLAVLVGWVVASTVLLGWVWLEVLPCDAHHTKERSTIEDSSRGAAIAVVMTASVLSLAGMAAGLVKAGHVGHPMRVLLTVMSVATVVSAWTVVHTMYALRYAHIYYTDPIGGVDFHSDEMPDYHDFAYMAFTVGMSFAISDTDVADRTIRRAVTQHALLSYLFGAVVVGMTINVMAGFVH